MAKKTIWDLSLEIAGKDTGASAALRQVQREMKSVQDAGKQLGNDFKSFASNAGKLALGVVGGVAAATTGVVAMANSFAEAGDNVAKTSGAIGIGIEAYQGLQHAMGQSGVSAEEFDSALKKFNQTVRLGAAGNAAAQKQLEEIGLSAQKLAGMKPEEAMMRLSDYMKSLPDDAARTQVALTVFGKAAGPRMMGAMKQGSEGLRELMDEAKSLGIVMTEEQAHQSEAYVDAITRLKQSVNGMKNQFIGGAIGPLTEAFDHLKDAIVEQMPAISELGKNFGLWLGDMVKRLPEIIAKAKEFGAWIKETVIKVKDFLGGWQNVAKIIGMLAIAPTFISGLKVIISLFGVLKAVVGLASGIMGLFGTSAGAAGAAAAAGGAAGATGFGALAAAVWAATWPVLAVIAGIAAVIAIIVLVVKNFDKIKEVAGIVWDAVCGFVGKAVDFIKNIFGGIGDFFSGVWGGIKNAASNAWSGIKNVASNAWEGIKGAASTAGGFLKNNWKSIAIGMVNPMAGGLHALYKNHEGFRNLVDGVWGKIKDVAGNAWEGIQSAASGAFNFLDNLTGGTLTKMKDNFLNGINNIKEFFTGLWSALKEGPAETIQYLKDTFFRLFDSIKENLTAFVDFFKNAISGVKDFFGGIGDKIGGLFNRGGNNNIPGHASGGIFTQPHIAQIAEAGAEAVVPLNRSPQGFDIWKQAGELGGYVDRMNQQTQTASTSGTPPVMEAAAQKISNNENVITINFSQNNTFSGGTPDKETVNQISAAGKQAADDIEVKFKILMEDFMRNQRRVSYV